MLQLYWHQPTVTIDEPDPSGSTFPLLATIGKCQRPPVEARKRQYRPADLEMSESHLSYCLLSIVNRLSPIVHRPSPIVHFLRIENHLIRAERRYPGLPPDVLRFPFGAFPEDIRLDGAQSLNLVGDLVSLGLGFL